MKHLFILVFLFSFTYAIPDWYYNLPNDKVNNIIGYGQGSNETEAKNSALNDIASQISISIKQDFSKKVLVQDNNYHQNIIDHSEITSSVELQGYEVKKLANEDGIFYIAIRYNNIPSIDKFNYSLDKMVVKNSEVMNSYLEKTPIANAIQKKVPFSLKRKNGLWYIGYRKIFQLLDKRDFLKFFTTVPNDSLTFNISTGNEILYEGDKFHFKIKSKNNGYITIFNVYEDGTVTILFKNHPIKKNKIETIPDKKHDTVLQANLMKPGVGVFDFYITLFTVDKQNYDHFVMADNELVHEERYKNFDELILQLNDKIFSSLLVVTKPK